MVKKIKQYFCKHHFIVNKIKRDEEKKLSYLDCEKCGKRFSHYYGYMILKNGTYEYINLKDKVWK